MKIELKKIKIKELINGFSDNQETGEVLGFFKKLNIRPPYQREFIYSEKQQEKVIQTIFKNFPLNVMYWAINNKEKYELIDGQQRILSICNFSKGDFSVLFNEYSHYFHNLPKDLREIFDNYELNIYICEGSDREKLEWFETINIAGEKLTSQELRNAIYNGIFINDLKTYFSKRNCPANVYKDYLKGSSIRQEWLETVLKWFSKKEKEDIDSYISKYKNDDKKAKEIWDEFINTMEWVEKVFPRNKMYLKYMSGVEWGNLYNNFKGIDTNFSEKVIKLITDDDVVNKKGIFEYLLDSKEKHLSLRNFTYDMKNAKIIEQGYSCKKCNKLILMQNSHADHITPWSKGGKTEKENLQILCEDCNRKKSDI